MVGRGAGRTTATTVPGAPTGLTATASGTTAINLSWSAPASTGGSAITGYKIDVLAQRHLRWTDQVANTNSTATTYAHTGLAGGTTRHYRVSAINTNGAGTASNVDSATTGTTVPGAPTGLTATASGTTGDQPLLERPGEHRRLRHHRLQDRGLPNGRSGWTDQVANTNSTATTYAHTGLTAGTTRHYRVSAINTNGTGTPPTSPQRHHRHHRARRPDRPHGHGQRDHRDQPLLERPGSTGGSAITGYKIEVSAQRHLRLDRPGRQHHSTATTYATPG